MPQVSRYMNRWLWVLALCWFSVLILFFHSFLLLFTNNDAFAMVISCCHFFLSLVFCWTRKSRKMKKWFSWLSHYMNVFFLWPAGDCSGIKCYIKIVSFFDTYQGILCVFFSTNHKKSRKPEKFLYAKVMNKCIAFFCCLPKRQKKWFLTMRDQHNKTKRQYKLLFYIQHSNPNPIPLIK